MSTFEDFGFGDVGASDIGTETPDENAVCGCESEFGDRTYNIGRNHFAVCETHRKFWRCGSNLFSSWHHETEADWARNAAELARYTETKPLTPR